MNISMNHLFATYAFIKPLDNVDNGTQFAARPLKQWRKQYQNKLGYSRASAGMPMDRPGGLVATSSKSQCNNCQGAFPMKLTLFKDSSCKSCHPIKNIVTPLKNQDKVYNQYNYACCPRIVTILQLEKAALAANAFTASVDVFHQEALNVISSGLPSQVIISISNSYTLAEAACKFAASAFKTPTAATFLTASTAFTNAATAFTNTLMLITELNGTSALFPDIINVLNLGANAFIVPSALNFAKVVDLIDSLPENNPVVTLLKPFTDATAAF
jgi:hypothetical protein